MFRRPLRTVFLEVMPALVCCLALGCGDQTTRVSGTVTFEGQSVPTGKIYFFPDTSKGNSGPTGHADIVDGSFDTSWKGGAGAVPGPILVRIEGFTPIGGEGEITSKRLFSPYETKIELPKGSSTQKFEVPASAAKPPRQGGGR